MSKILIDLKFSIKEFWPNRCIDGMHDDWWKKFESSAFGINDGLRCLFNITDDFSKSPPMRGKYADFSDVSLLTDCVSFNICKGSLIDGLFDVDLDAKKRCLNIDVNGKFGFWLGDTELNADDWLQAHISSSLEGLDILPLLHKGKYFFASNFQPVDKKGKIIKTSTTQFGSEMHCRLAPESDLALLLPYKLTVLK